jgi:biotin carboxyl carrier protein
MDGKHAHTRGVHSSDSDGASSAHGISVEQIQHLVKLLDNSDVSELELKSVVAGTRLVLRKARSQSGPEQQATGVIQSPAVAAGAAVDQTAVPIVASLVGTFHSWARPKGGTLVAVGDRVKVGQLVATIESLNVINEVESQVAGRVVEILVQDGQPVEYGQHLMLVEKAEEA